MASSALYLLTPVLGYLIWRAVRSFLHTTDVGLLPGPPAQSWLTGNMPSVSGPDGSEWQDEMTRKYGRVWKLNGPLNQNFLFVNDPLALHHIYMKEQSAFEAIPMVLAMNELLFGKGILASSGTAHRRQRKLLSSAFSISHIRTLVPTFNNVARQLCDQVNTVIEDKSTSEIDVFDLFSLVTLEGIGQAGLGHSFNVFSGKQAHNEHLQAIRGLFKLLQPIAPVIMFLPLLMKIGSPSFRRWIVNHTPLPSVQATRNSVDVLYNVAASIVEERKHASANGNNADLGGSRKDLMSVLLKANMEASEEDRISDEELVGQMSTFIFAGYETTASALARILHLLSQDLEAQTRLREEVTNARKEGGELSFNELATLPYLDAVIRETLRLYSPVNISPRETKQTVVVPFSAPVETPSGKLVAEVVLPKGATVFVGIRAANFDPAVWGDDAKEWKPERWIGRKPDEVAKEKYPSVYSGIMTFSAGIRSCIGFKFAELEMKIFISALLENFVFLPSKKNSQVFWKAHGVNMPTLDGKVQLPLSVSKVSRD